MSYINQIVEGGVTYDIAANNLVDGFTQTTAGVNALDAKAGKTLNDSITSINNFLSHFKSTSNLTTTIDTMLDNGFYAMNGSSALGTFPASTGKYGVLLSIHRGTNDTFQLLFTGSKMCIREAGTSMGAWTTIV